jgi:hypothetical protein
MSDATIIDVTFVDAESGKTFLQLKLPLRQLATPSMTLGKDEWFIVGATPSDIAEVEKTGVVRLLLRKVQSVDPNTILFSLPTVADVIPEPEPTDRDLSSFRLSEDDWLQLELVPSEVVAQAQPDLDAIRRVLDHERQSVGFKHLHVRKALPNPFAGQELLLETLQAEFGATRTVAYVGSKGVLPGCFAFDLASGATLYGQTNGPRVVSLGLSARDDEALARLGGLTLIDWCAAEAKRV